MCGNWFAAVKAIALFALAATLSVGPARAQQNSQIFPWNSGYQSYSQNASPGEPYTEYQYSTPTPYVYPQPAIVGTSAPAAPVTTATGEEEEEFVNEARPAFIQTKVPANAQLWFENDKTKSTGMVRNFVSPPLQPDKTYTYSVRAHWIDANGKPVDETRQVKVQSGRRTAVDFLARKAQ